MGEFGKRRFRDRSSGPATLINEGCKITGFLSGNGDFMISGEVEGDCDLDGTVAVTQHGIWRGTLKARSVVIAGTIEGDIESAGRVEIANSARITGTVTGEAIAVAEGAVVQGIMKTTGRAEPVEFTEKRKVEEAAADTSPDAAF